MRSRMLASVVVLVAWCVPGLAVMGPVDAASPDPSAVAQRAAVPNPAANLGKAWSDSGDILITGIGDTNGFHVYRARERESFAWTELATLNAGLHDVGAWTGYTCVTGSGRYAAVVYAPISATNRQASMMAGAFAAVVDTTNGTVRRVTRGVQLSYFNPACGPTDRILLTRAIGRDLSATDLMSVDAVTAKIISTRRIAAQLTTPVPAADGDYGVVHRSLVRVDKAGRFKTVATPGGQPFGVRATASGAIDLVSTQERGGQERAAAYRFNRGKLVRLGEAPSGQLHLFALSGGRNALVGDLHGLDIRGVADLVGISSDREARAVSREGHLLVTQMLTRQNRESVAKGGAPARPTSAGELRVTVRTMHSGRTLTGTVKSSSAQQASGDAVPGKDMKLAEEEPPDPGPPHCAIPRNNIHRQAFQPSANQVEWAVDLAVQGILTVQRPQNYLHTGMPAYTPQGMFPLPSGAPRVPAQIMLAILAQESNMSEASWHAVAGDGGNPLISDYYGQRDEWGNNNIDIINYSDADCGYGISQVTDNMYVDDTGFTESQKVAIATDYAANIAAGLQILVEKWQQVEAAGMYVNDGSPEFIENWFLAVWAYNSGFYPRNGDQPYGVGWFNNPANPIYDNSHHFLRVLDDASHPADWSYPERIMGWAETPQWQWIEPTQKYSPPHFGQGGQLDLPDAYQFCSLVVNNCDPNDPDNPCPAVDSSCWWSATNTFWASCPQDCATEHLTYVLLDPEPPTLPAYPRSCTPLNAPTGALVVDDLRDSSNNVLGCQAGQWGGKFTLRIGSPSGGVYSDYAQVDLHQLGAGYLGHSWFTHVYSSGGEDQRRHQVVGTWTPNITQARPYEIFVHLMSHGANYGEAEYLIDSAGPAGEIYPCTIDQDRSSGADIWVYLGVYYLYPAARVQLSNAAAGEHDGSVDIGFDAMAFNPAPQAPYHSCGDAYNG